MSAPITAAKRYKYGNTPTTVDGILFASAKESRRYSELRLMEKAGEISKLELQPSFALIVNGNLICRYRPDFSYIDKRTGKLVIEDVKGVRTPTYKLKKALMVACLGHVVVET